MLISTNQTNILYITETIGVEEISTPGFLPEVQIPEKRKNEILASTLDLAAQAGEITVRPVGNRYEILYGLEYYFAYKELFPRGSLVVSIYNYTDPEAVNISFSLNSSAYKWTSVDFSCAYEMALRYFDWDKTTLAKALGKARATISNMLRMNDLDPIVSNMIRRGELRSEHGKHLCRLAKPQQRILAKKCASNKWNTRELYNEIKGVNGGSGENLQVVQDEFEETSSSFAHKDSNVAYVENTMSDVLGCNVNLDLNCKSDYSGTMELNVYSLCELQGIAEKILNNDSKSIEVAGEIKFKIRNSAHLNQILSAFVSPDDF